MADPQPPTERTLSGETHADVWAQEFCKRWSLFTPEGVALDPQGIMLTWFANAIETGRDAGRAEKDS